MNAPLRAPEVPMSYFTNSRSILGTIVLLIIILLCFTHTDVSDYRQLTAVTEVQRTHSFIGCWTSPAPATHLPSCLPLTTLWPQPFVANPPVTTP